MVANIINKQRGLKIQRGLLSNTIKDLAEDGYFKKILDERLGPYCGDLDDLEINIMFVCNRKMKELNRTYRQKDYVTDVLSFSYLDELLSVKDVLDPRYELGDIVICAPQALKQANERGIEINEELLRLIIHCILHLLGYDHEISPKEARRMRYIENRLFKRVYRSLNPKVVI